MRAFLQRWLITTLAVLVAVYLVRGMHYERTGDLLVASLLLGVFNAFLRPLLLLIAVPLGLLTVFLQPRPTVRSLALTILALALLFPLINALLLYLVGALLSPHFRVEGFWAAFWGALIIGLVSLAANSLTGTGNSRIAFHRGKAPPSNDRDKGNDQVIDV